MRLGRYLPILILIIVAVALQLILVAAGGAYYMTQITMSLYSALVVIGLCLLIGYAGQVSLGHAGFFAIGGYVSAFLTTHDFSSSPATPLLQNLLKIGVLVQRQDLYGNSITHLSPWLALLSAIIIASGIALLIGFPVIRLRGHYLAMATLGFGIIIYRIVLGAPWFGQADGISEVPPFKLFAGLAVNGRAPYRIENYYIACALVVAAMILGINLVRSRVGRALRSIHDDEHAALALGVNVARYKLGVFVLSAALAAVAGVFATHYNGAVSPSETTAMKSIRYVAIVAAGGMANLWGALIMGVALTFLSLRGVFGSYDDAVFGVILISIMLFAPNGIIRRPGFFRRAGRKEENRGAVAA